MCKRRIKQKQHPKPRFSRGFRILWVVLSKLWVPWQTAAQLMQPAMVKARAPRCKSATWLPFLRNHMDVSWAIDFFTINTIRFATLYVFLVLHHGRRKLVHFAITSNPSMGWVIQQLREAMPYGQQPRFLFRDNDGIYGGGVRDFLDSCDIEEVRTAYR